jgi:hypothetical protein
VESKLAETRAADSYKAFKELCDPANIYVGVRQMENGKWKVGNDGAAFGGELESSVPADTEIFNSPFSIVNSGEAAGEPLIWLIAPSPDGQFAAVEFAVADSATFVYRTGGDFIAFAKQLNRALEAINFKREVIRLSDDELRKPENANYYMAAKRTAALQFVRANFAGRVIHSGAESWKRNGEDVLCDESSNLEAECFSQFDREAVRSALAALTDDERQMVEYLYLSKEPGTVRGYEKLTGISKSAVSRRQIATLAKLKKFLSD